MGDKLGEKERMLVSKRLVVSLEAGVADLPVFSGQNGARALKLRSSQCACTRWITIPLDQETRQGEAVHQIRPNVVSMIGRR